jgi:hypothetical protein
MRRIEVHRGLQWENLKEGNHLGDSGLDVITVFSQREIGWEGMDWINLSLERRK